MGQAKLLRLAGLEMDLYDVDQWREEAHRAASFLLGSRILLVTLPYQRLSSAHNSMAQTVMGSSPVPVILVFPRNLFVHASSAPFHYLTSPSPLPLP